jgi:wyosine [tRNA(Phe)-imidazoG37] synthetase (radical SAM superfamily)
MATFLFNEIIFGPVKSRRLGASLGINLLPVSYKLCNFDCIYCECGWSKTNVTKEQFPERLIIKNKLEARLIQMQNTHEALDALTFAGNGEPTIHPDFAGIIKDTIELRNNYFPKANIAVLSNSSMIHNEKVLKALASVEYNILKLDSGYEDTLNLINKPAHKIEFRDLILNLKKVKNLTIQTLFLKGTYNDKVVDNSTQKEVEKWLETLKELNPKMVMIYTIERDCPVDTLYKVPKHRLDEIAGFVKEMGIPVQTSY